MEKKMSIEIRVPQLGESIVDAVVATWLKHEGDTVQQGEAVVELETDKANIEVSAEQSGILQMIKRHEGDYVAVDEVLGIITSTIIKIFFCYAREDELLLNKLKSHLRPLQRQGLINVWHDRDIRAGTEWEQEI